MDSSFYGIFTRALALDDRNYGMKCLGFCEGVYNHVRKHFILSTNLMFDNGVKFLAAEFSSVAQEWRLSRSSHRIQTDDGFPNLVSSFLPQCP